MLRVLCVTWLHAWPVHELQRNIALLHDDHDPPVLGPGHRNEKVGVSRGGEQTQVDVAVGVVLGVDRAFAKNARGVQSLRLYDQPAVRVQDDLGLVDQTLLNVLANRGVPGMSWSARAVRWFLRQRGCSGAGPVSWPGSRAPTMPPVRAPAMPNENASAPPGPCLIPAAAAAATIAPATPVPSA